MSLTTRRPLRLLTLVGLAAVGVLLVAQSASAFINRPKSATPLSASMVIAYTPCTAPNVTHNPATLPGAACDPPTKLTPRLTSGSLAQPTTAAFEGRVALVVSLSPSDITWPVS